MARFRNELTDRFGTDIQSRYERHAPLLLDRLKRLYGAVDHFDDWFATLVDTVVAIHVKRPEALCVLDAQRSVSPDWFMRQDMLGYSAYVDRLAPTLADVAKRIPHLRELGVTYLHLLPFLRARSAENDGGFAVASYEEVDPRLGTMDDLDVLTARLRDAGISLCADFVLNHVADDHRWALGAANGDKRLRGYFHVFPDRALPDLYERSLGQIFPQAAPGNFTHVAAVEGWVWTTFYPYQWDLNYSNPEVFAEMAAALLNLANRGVEVFRLDSTAFLWKRPGTDCMNQPEAHWILQALRCLIDIAAPAVLLKAEAIVPTKDLRPYFGEADGHGRECHLAYHSSLMASAWAAVAEQDTTLLRRVIASTPVLPERCTWVTYVRCHDDIGWNVLRSDAGNSGKIAEARLEKVSSFFAGNGNSFARGAAFQTQDGVAVHGTNGMTAALVGFYGAGSEAEIDAARRRLILLYSLALCFGGMPMVYMGDEIALGNDSSSAGVDLAASDGRWLQRPVMDASRFVDRYRPDSDAGKVFSEICRLSDHRRRLNALAAGQPRRLFDSVNPSVLAIGRGDGFIALMNFSSNPVMEILTESKAVVDGALWMDCFSGSTVSSHIHLAPWCSVWLERVSSTSHPHPEINAGRPIPEQVHEASQPRRDELK